jgi:methyl-accepting chemotaxis protein
MATRKVTFRIFSRVLLLMLLVAAIPIAGLWYISIYRAQQDWRQAVEENLNRAAQALENKLDAWMTMNLYILQGSAALADIISMDPARQNPILQSLGATYPWTYLLFTVTPTGRNIGRSDGLPTRDYGDRRYVQQIAQGSPLAHEALLSKTTGQPALAFSVPIHNAQHALVGIMALSSSLVEVSKATTNVQLGKTGFAIVLDDTGKLIAHGKPEQVTGTLHDLNDHPVMQRGVQNKMIVFRDHDKLHVGYLKKLPQGWSIIVQQDYEEAFSALHQAKEQAILLLAITLLGVIVLALSLVKRLVNPLQHLTAVADAMSRGYVGLDTPLDEARRHDEIGDLARAFERVSISLRTSVAPNTRQEPSA